MNQPTPPPLPPSEFRAPVPTQVHVHYNHPPPSAGTDLAKGCSVFMLLVFMIPFFIILAFMPATWLTWPLTVVGLAFLIGAIFRTKRRSHSQLYEMVPITETVPTPAPEPVRQLTLIDKQAELFRSLPEDGRVRHTKVTQKCARLQTLAERSEDLETQAQLGPGLEKLQWLHLKFLLAREHLQTHTPSHLHDDLAGKLTTLRTALADPALSVSARQSKQSTLEMTEERLRNLESRQARLTEIESDLERIESQLDLSLERAALESSGSSRSFQLDLAERMVDSSELFGASLPLVDEMDAHFQAPERA